MSKDRLKEICDGLHQGQKIIIWKNPLVWKRSGKVFNYPPIHTQFVYLSDDNETIFTNTLIGNDCNYANHCEYYSKIKSITIES